MGNALLGKTIWDVFYSCNFVKQIQVMMGWENGVFPSQPVAEMCLIES